MLAGLISRESGNLSGIAPFSRGALRDIAEITMRSAKTIVLAGLLSVGALGLSFSSASARIVCNDEGDCWHTHTEYTYPPAVRLEVHPDDWKWKETEKHAWREHEGRGYWHSGAWVGF